LPVPKFPRPHDANILIHVAPPQKENARDR
jgi:hypothetical protein